METRNILDFVTTVLTVFGLFQHCVEKEGLEGCKIRHMMVKKLFEEWDSKGQEQRKKTIHTLLLHNVLLRAVNY